MSLSANGSAEPPASRSDRRPQGPRERVGRVVYTIAPIGDDDDSTGFVAINRDVTELKEYERKLEEQNERLKQYGQTVAHDLRNPMMLLKGKLDLFETSIGDSGIDAEEAHRRCRDIREVVDRMEVLVDDLLTMAEQSQRVLDFESVSIEAVAHEWSVDVGNGDEGGARFEFRPKANASES